MFVAVAFMVGKPFRKSMWTNIWFTLAAICIFIFNAYLIWNPWNDEWLLDSNTGLSLIYSGIYRSGLNKTIFMICMINGILTLIWERVVVSHVSIFWNKYKDPIFRKNLKNKEFTL